MNNPNNKFDFKDHNKHIDVLLSILRQIITIIGHIMQEVSHHKHKDPDKCKSAMFAISYDSVLSPNDKMHWHYKAQLLYAIQGNMEVTIDNKYFLLPPARAIFIPSKLPHKACSTQIVKYRSIYFDPNYFKNLPQAIKVINVSALLKESIKQACTICLNDTSQLYENALAQLIIEEVKRTQSSPFFLELPEDHRLQKILNYLKEKQILSENADIIASRFGMSTRTLSRLCMKELGISFYQWYQQLRLLKAIEKIATGLSTHEVASLLGYSNDSAFITMFKRFTGVTPSKFKN